MEEILGLTEKNMSWSLKKMTKAELQRGCNPTIVIGDVRN